MKVSLYNKLGQSHYQRKQLNNNNININNNSLYSTPIKDSFEKSVKANEAVKSNNINFKISLKNLPHGTNWKIISSLYNAPDVFPIPAKSLEDTARLLNEVIATDNIIKTGFLKSAKFKTGSGIITGCLFKVVTNAAEETVSKIINRSSSPIRRIDDSKTVEFFADNILTRYIYNFQHNGYQNTTKDKNAQIMQRISDEEIAINNKDLTEADKLSKKQLSVIKDLSEYIVDIDAKKLLELYEHSYDLSLVSNLALPMDKIDKKEFLRIGSENYFDYIVQPFPIQYQEQFIDSVTDYMDKNLSDVFNFSVYSKTKTKEDEEKFSDCLDDVFAKGVCLATLETVYEVLNPKNSYENILKYSNNRCSAKSKGYKEVVNIFTDLICSPYMNYIGCGNVPDNNIPVKDRREFLFNTYNIENEFIQEKYKLDGNQRELMNDLILDISEINPSEFNACYEKNFKQFLDVIKGADKTKIHNWLSKAEEALLK